MYVHLPTLKRLLYYNIIKHFSIRRFVFTLVFLILYLLLLTVVTVGRLVDELLFFGYRNTKIDKPVFIIANPRSGTTYLHRLLCLDEERYSYTLLYHTILPCISLVKLIQVLGWLDSKVGSPLRNFFDWLNGVVFAGWKNIHPMGFNQSEEDEGMFVFPLMTPGIFLLIPFINEMDDSKFMDEMPAHKRKALMQYYVNSLQRFMYATGRNKIFLSKNVMSTGRFQCLIEHFPDAKVVYLIRNPYNVIPSFISMFTAAWKAHSPDVGDDSPEARAWGELGIRYYQYFYEMRAKFPKNQLVTVAYKNLVERPYETVTSIYQQFDMPMSDAFLNRLEEKTKVSRTYKSKHSYSLEQYGLTAKDIHEPLDMIFEEFGFEKLEA